MVLRRLLRPLLPGVARAAEMPDSEEEILLVAPPPPISNDLRLGAVMRLLLILLASSGLRFLPIFRKTKPSLSKGGSAVI
mmetsp:Transcript_42504/g.103132  ORF Transcript_42504/g.103132 Transcript_42504/m.103132 type:complete len:80 (+) Transcript_42504:17-256(+)